jgi:transglutaminase-like putative cysteine protease
MGIIKYLYIKKFYLILLTIGMFVSLAGVTPAVFATDGQDVKMNDYIYDIESNSTYIQDLAQSITKDVNKTNRSEIVHSIFNWMQDHITYEKPMYYNSKHYAEGTAKLGMGYCCDQSRLFIALCRASGIPKNATEFNYSNAIQFRGGHVYGHVWPVVTLENNKKLICDTSSVCNTIGHPKWINKGTTTSSYSLSM